MAKRPVSLEHSGLAIVDKPAGMTSHDVVGILRRAFRTRRVGHAGTLDPAATGVLVVGIERATKLLGLLQLATKTYETTIVLGASTTTEDADGEIVDTASPAVLDNLATCNFQAVAQQFVGDIQQVPSAVSAIKIDGVRAHERVRRGETVTLEARPVTINSFDISAVERDTETGYWRLRATVDCSSGTYIRALARDFGQALQIPAHICELRRTRVGDFSLKEAQPLDYYKDCQKAEELPALSLDLDQATQWGRNVRHVSPTEAHKLALGQAIDLSGLLGTYAAVDGEGHTIALLREENDKLRFVFVVRPATLK